MINDLKDRIVETLEGIDGVEQVIQAPSTEFTSFPAATVALRGGETVRLDTHRNNKATMFEVKLWTDPTAGRVASEDELIDILDTVTATFEDDRCFGGLANMTSVSWEKTTQTGSGTFDFATITIELKSITAIS